MNCFGFFLCFLTTKGIQGGRIVFSLDIVFSCNKRMQNVTKKLGFLLVFFFAIIELGGPIFFLGFFFLMFPCSNKSRRCKNISFFFHCCKKIDNFSLCACRFVTTWLLGKVVVYIDLGIEGQKEMQLQLSNMLLHQNE